ncbi:unnamed protein product [Mytilus coruscus]|uniref:Uncharacterized protein n=1 Tax=Mytilus coruscus TaxID=42192 RepID=A0A6J8B3G7_MYTCO|nr:unnamed protein product [Mytilus coruscus]
MPQTLIEGITGEIDTHTQAGTSKSHRTPAETVGTSKSYSKEVTQLSLLGKAKAMSVEIQQFLQEYRPRKLLPKVGNMFNNYVDTTKGITEDERDDLTSYLCSFKEINFSVIYVPTMVHDTISFIVHHSDKTVDKEVNNDLIAIGLADEPTEEATSCNQFAEATESRLKDDHSRSPNKRKKERNDTEKGNDTTNCSKLVKIEEQKLLLKKRKIEILERMLLIEEEKLKIIKQQHNEININNATNLAMELLTKNI